jgi:hypothetical protein
LECSITLPFNFINAKSLKNYQDSKKKKKKKSNILPSQTMPWKVSPPLPWVETTVQISAHDMMMNWISVVAVGHFGTRPFQQS